MYETVIVAVTSFVPAMYIPFERYELALSKSVITDSNSVVSQSIPFNVSDIPQFVSAVIVIQQSGSEMFEKDIVTSDAFFSSSAETNSSRLFVKVFSIAIVPAPPYSDFHRLNCSGCCSQLQKV
ncbi:MAG: hypothetical protein ACI4MA_09120 [Treponema sp.]